MVTSLLKTKFYRPKPSPNNILRPRLHKTLDKGLSGKLTLVAAPAGFGKTTLISSWVQQHSQVFAWVSLDQADNDVTIFWAYVVSALQQVCGRIHSTPLTAFDPGQLPSTQVLLTTLINGLAAIPQKIVLVLDDYHVISNPAIHEQLGFLIDNLPAQLHIVLSTRADPPLPLARLRAKAQLNESRADDLRFTLAEATTFLNEVLELELDPSDIQTLEARTEGWAAGLQLAALSMQGRTDKRNFIADFSGSHHFVLEYLTEEVINRLPEGQRLFLLQTAILDSFCADLCDRVTGTASSADQISQLLRSNLFLVPLDDERVWFRYHHLFADLLKNRLQQDFSEQEILVLYEQAGQWHQERGNLDQAIKYYLLAQEFEQATRWIEQVASSTMMHGQLKTILNWIDAIPENIIEIHPRLRFYQAWALSLGGQPKIAEGILVETKASLETLPDSPENRVLRGELAALLTGIITYYNDPSRTIREGQEALTYLPEDNLISRARIHIALGTAYAYSDDRERAIETYKLARDLALKAKNSFLAAAAVELLAGMQIYHLGQLKTAQQHLEQVLVWGKTKDGMHQAFTGTSHILLSAIFLEWNRLDEAAQYLDKGVELVQQSGIGYSLTYAYCTKARLLIALGEIDEATVVLRQANQAAETAPLAHILLHNLSCQTRLALYIGDVDSASRWIERGTKIPGNYPPYLNEVRQISAARVYLAHENFEKTIATIDCVLDQAEAAGRMAHVIESYLLEALAYQQQRETSKAITVLKKAISLAAPEDFTRIFLEGGRPVLKLLRSIAGQDFNRRYVNQLLAAFDGKTTMPEMQDVTSGKLTIQNELAEPLSERECEVLKLIAAGYTNQQIADTLVVSLNTVKKHTTHIFGKLGVKNRTEASNRARELGLI